MTKKQRRRVWGSVTEMRRGKKYVLRWMQNTPQGRRRKTKTVYGTYREACAELDRIHVEHADDAPVPTIAKAYETWLVPKMAAQVEAGTLASIFLIGARRGLSGLAVAGQRRDAHVARRTRCVSPRGPRAGRPPA